MVTAATWCYRRFTELPDERVVREFILQWRSVSLLLMLLLLMDVLGSTDCFCGNEMWFVKLMQTIT